MSNLRMERRIFTDRSTIGLLFLDGNFECFTLEPSGSTEFPGIPAGGYLLSIRHSDKFGRDMPHIENVPGRAGIEIHAGNTPQDTEGCVLVGETIGPSQDFIGGSRSAFKKLFAKLTPGTIIVV